MSYRVNELFVDTLQDGEKIPVRLNITLPKMSCDCKYHEIATIQLELSMHFCLN